ncbi:BspA family leucine-rich repeat surface protein [Mycoplasma mycoides]|uniref:BspA family leucine-rich repeat surface protein n=1 Tax=Mycoplasma mycoides TaxID=2102 RepID=UPI002733BC31|nr:BspA family leucine-rich repeat surface protein [Mycoplasma mycoides]MDP4040807.1 BspA family leucine-rich repeat surface protein [Mycoplasma mycoides]MDP4041698.1 BspA family leucine-rich repeat surface protein [Mycoplasma mycoides]MDP4042568.1 BspA family leucine-rich repeat surface protein [Mycoplasma mycoides]MDP4044031.1 BspA family leucine-rich repeat surface protein [Mycoplasma mycoides]MDP4044645.1 BspA family leucine-rich repeat surface protein [Mycoplasma mycoides]
MKKLLTILTSCSFGFLITTSIILVNKNNGENNIYLKSTIREKPHKTSGHRLTEVGYYWDGHAKQVRIKQIPAEIKTIAAELPPEITSLKGAFQTIQNDITWEVDWNTKNITNMNSMFYNTTWFNSEAILKWDTSNVTDMGEMFGRAMAFNRDLSNWDVSKVKNFEKMFEGASEYNNGGKHLNWKDKLKSATNMEKMFNKAKKFSHSLSDWKLDKKVKNSNFGLDVDKQPQWVKVEATKPIATPPAISPRSDETILSVDPVLPKIDETPALPEAQPNNSHSNPKPNIITPNETPNIPIQPIENETNSNNSSDEVEENTEIKKNNKTSTDEKTESLKNSDNTYKIPSAKPNTIIKSNSPSAAVIAVAVLGSFTVLGIVGGTGYYYRKNLKNFYLNSANRTKNLYFKSKEKIKDKLSKIKSKK